MEITGERTVAVAVDTVWNSLFRPDVLKESIPGCESVLMESSTLYQITTSISIGPIKARFQGTLAIADAQAPFECTLVFEGRGGSVGMAKGTAKVQLAEVPEGSRLSYVADAQISGKLAQVGSRLIESVARKLSAVFFEKFERSVLSRVAQESKATLVQHPTD